ncbi:MAG: hypothetical protein WC782_16945 [Methylococcaceae bacterium]|jgi:hypothetical protein
MKAEKQNRTITALRLSDGLDTEEAPICSTHGTEMVEYVTDYEPSRCLGRWFKCTHSQGTSDQCTNVALIQSEKLKIFHKTGKWPKIGA